MSRTLLVVPTAAGVGLARTCLGVVRALDRRGVNVAFVKPVAQPRADGGPDRSTALVAATTALRPPEPLPAAQLEQQLGTGGFDVVLETIVAELLGLSRVRVDENFFMLGGHSLLGAQLIARIGSRFGVEMSLRSLFDTPTVAEMATEVERLLIAEVAAMSDADAARLLAADSGTTSASADGGSSPRA